MYDLEQFLDPIDINIVRGDIAFSERQLGSKIAFYSRSFPDLNHADVIIVGVNEYRGAGFVSDIHPADRVREKLYKLFYWHREVHIADIGNIRAGASLQDSYFCLKTILSDFAGTGKSVIIIGGSHDMTLAQSYVYKEQGTPVMASVIDACIDLQGESLNRNDNFLVEMLTEEPNFIRQYNHIGFQSYFVDPNVLEVMDKLRFDCFRVGVCREKLVEMEPLLRDSHLISFDMNAIRFGDSPDSGISPNGFTGEEACSLAKYAGQSDKADSFGIYGFQPGGQKEEVTSSQVAQMIWYYIDGKNLHKHEATLSDLKNFNQFHTSFLSNETTIFMQSKKTGRWWMKLPDGKYISCSRSDYVHASNREVPERWLRAQEREY